MMGHFLYCIFEVFFLQKANQKILSWWQDLFTKRGRYGAQKSSATDERIYISKQNYTGVPADQQKEALRKFHEENPNMFMPNEEPNHTIIPQVSTQHNRVVQNYIDIN